VPPSIGYRNATFGLPNSTSEQLLDCRDLATFNSTNYLTPAVVVIGGVMKALNLMYVAVGFAVARWIFQRKPAPVLAADPVQRFRTSGLL